MNYISYIYWEIRYRLRKRIWDNSAKKSDCDGIVLMYHHVTDEDVETNASCKCRIDEFENTILHVKAEGRKFVSVEEMLRIIDEKSHEQFAVISFDDVPDNFYTNAYPFLKQEKIPFILFITTDFIDKPGYLSMMRILELDNDSLCTIGAHTMTHPMLRKVDNSKQELAESKKILENLLGHAVNFMAYPFGRQSSVSNRIIRETKNVGYQCAFGTIQSHVTDKSAKNRFYIPRIVRKS